MTGQEIVSKAKDLQLPDGSYIVFGSGPLAAAGIREAQDIDFLVDKALFEKFRQLGWKQITKRNNNKQLVNDVFEVHDNWNFNSYKPSLEHLLASATIIDGVPFAALEEVKKWKTVSGRPKDIVDLELIAKHLA